MDITSVRAEIKAWERAFKADNARDATVDDIKAHPNIAAKYKLYKKLSKEAASTSVHKSSNAGIPSTPPRRPSALPGPSSLVPKSRAIHSSTDATSSNPFSPTKSPRKKYISPNEAPMGMPNFMKEPTTPPSKKRGYSTPSPELFAPIEPAPDADTPIGNTAVKKARKRLRGDIVSPSPKKPRIVPRTNSGLHEGSDVPEDDGETEETYIGESPVKQSLNGKDFKLLFEERLPTLDFSGKKGPFSGTQSVFTTSDKRPKDALHIFPEAKADEVRRPLEQSRGKELPTLMKTGKSKAPTMKSISSGKQPFTAMKSTPEGASVIADSDLQNAVAPRTTRKRSSSEDVDDSAANKQSFSDVNGGLLPPSPPPSGTIQSNNRAGTGKGQTKNRKKAKLLANSNLDEDSMEDEQDLQIVDYKPQSKRRTRHPDGDEEEEDMAREVLGVAGIDRFGDVPEDGEGEIDGAEPDINLPENLRKVLYISSSQARVREERALVDSLLQRGPGSQGQRGEVWGIGEVEDTTAAITDGEDDWAGEGVPWEVGEL